VVYVTANNEQPGNVYALRANDGRLLWHYRASASLNGITLVDGVAYVTGQDGTLTALRSSDGLRLWQRALGGGNIATLWQPIQALNGVLYVATTKMSAPAASMPGPGLLPQALSIGSLLWGNVQAVPARQMMPHKEGVSALFAIRASDGAMLWHFTMNNGKNGMIGWFTLANGVIYTNVMDFSTSDTSSSHFYALQSTTGSVLWHHDDTHTSLSGAVLANGVIYVSAYTQDRNTVVYALRAIDGSILWHQAMDHVVYNAPTLNGATVYVGTDDGSVYALRANNGAIEWHHGA
jgi:outer membrane protein assembly factor BamB